MTELVPEAALVETITRRLIDVRGRMKAAHGRSEVGGPAPRLIGVSKRHPLDTLVAAGAAGLEDFGENYAQELRDKLSAWSSDAHRWHFIGALQSNKLKYMVGRVQLIHTVDRASLIHAIDRRAASQGLVQDFLVQVDLADESQKAGISPSDLSALLDVCGQTEHGAARCVGLMIIPPAGTPEHTRRWFRALRELRDALLGGPERARVDLRELSMGMSADFEVAIEEGATLVRVGTALFGPRPG